jgi:hypothetical protein
VRAYSVWLALLSVTLFLVAEAWIAPRGVSAQPPACQPVIPNDPNVGIDDFNAGLFSKPTIVNNRFLPYRPGTQLVLQGVADRGFGPEPHLVITTVTDLSKKVNGVDTLVIWDQDIFSGQLVESEIAFFAQDDRGVVWGLGEAPQEVEDGELGFPNAWAAGVQGALAGIHMRANPGLGQSGYLQGFAPEIDFADCARVIAVGQSVCTPAGCFSNVIVVEESNPLEPDAGRQLKFHAPGIGVVRVEAVEDPEGEFLQLFAIRQLDKKQALEVRKEARSLNLSARKLAPDVFGKSAPLVPLVSVEKSAH